MVKKSSICSSVEGMKLSFKTRQFYPKRPIINEELGRRVYPFKLGINGYVEIITPIENPEKNTIYKTSLSETGDAIQGGSVDGWSTKLIKPPTVKIATGTHSATFGSVTGHSYAHVESPPREHLQSKDIQSRHPEIIQVVNPVYEPVESP
jgi:hypothetical protein